MNFCTDCGARVSPAIPDGDNRERDVCASCGRIHYQNPKVVCGCIPVWGEKILLCKRAIEPRYGLWTLPAGFLENGETIQDGAARETMEEACAEVGEQKLFGIYNILPANQVYVMFRAQMQGGDRFAAGAESLDARLFLEDEIPWDEIAFRVIRVTLERYLAERKTGAFTVTIEDLL